MVRILLDTSNNDLVVALAGDKEIVGQKVYACPHHQSEYLVEEIGKLLDEHYLTKDDIDGVVSSKGPGSYTGVRVALTVAKVMAFALNVPLYLVSSLEILKDPKKVSICLANARNERSFFGVYDGDKVLVSDRILTDEDVKKYIEEHPDYVVKGDTNYLNIPSDTRYILENLKNSARKEYQVEDVLKASPVYLKGTQTL